MKKVQYATLSESPILVGPVHDVSDAYAAGIIDGEGCLGITRNGKYYDPRVDIGMVSKALPVLRSLHARYGGNLYLWRKETKNWDSVWRWCVYQGSVVRRALDAWLPYLILKRDQALVLLEFLDLQADVLSKPSYQKGRKGRFTLWTPELKEKAKALHARAAALNKKGPQNNEATP